MNQAVAINPAINPAIEASRWSARLGLRLARRARGTRLIDRRHHGPLYVQRPFYPEGPELAHIYLLHPPGGLVSGDELDYDIALEADARALFTTPGAGRMYRAREDQTPQWQRVRLQVAAGAAAEWLPLENIVYPGARAHLNTRVDLAADSRFIGWEINCTGLTASGAPFDRGRLRQSFQLYREGRPLLIETLNLDMADDSLYRGVAGLGGHSVSGVLVATLPVGGVAEDEVMIEDLRALAEGGAPRLAVTRVGELLVIRYLGPCSHEARGLFEAAWRRLRPAVLGRSPCTPRIWYT